MKQKYILFLLFICCSIKAYSKDSTFVFKISAGINYSLPDELAAYNHLWFSHGGNGYDRLSNSYDNTGFSPIIKVGAHKMFGKHTGLLLQASYYYSRLDYTHTISSTIYSNPIDPSVNITANMNITANSRLHRNHFNLALGPVFYFGRFYVSPKIDVSLTRDLIKTDSTYQKTIVQSDISESSSYKRNNKDGSFMMAAGLLAGYDFKIGKHILFIELQSDYDLTFNSGPQAYHRPPPLSFESSLSNFKTAFTLGIGF